MNNLFNFIVFLLVTGFALYLSGRVLYSRYMYIKLGKPVKLKVQFRKRIHEFISQVFGQKKLLKDKKSGIMHIVMFYGFIIIQFGALDIIYKGLLGTHLPIPGYHYFTLIQEITVTLVLLAVLYATYRRYVERLKRLKRGWKPSIVIFLISFLMISVLFTMGFESLARGEGPSIFFPVSSLVVFIFSNISQLSATVLYHFFWWTHLLILLSFAIYVPQSKHLHLITAPINILFRKTDPPGKLNSIDFTDENSEIYGVGKIEDFNQKQMLDFYSCVECGRCTNVCPASATGKILSPMHLIVKLRDHLTEKGAVITSKSPWVPSFAFNNSGFHAVQADSELAPKWKGQEITDIEPTFTWQKNTWRKSNKNQDEIQLIGDVITEEEIWACTTCRNCEDQCPVGNEHVDKIIDLRRHLVLMEGQVPNGGQRAMQNIERQGNPWGISRNDRAKWMEGLEDVEIPTVEENPDFEYLLFVGSMGSYDNRSVKVTHAIVRLFHQAGLNYAVLGNLEKNSGDTPRRLGNEFLFQELCNQNIEIFRNYKVKKIVTACPHTFNTLKNEYPEFGFEAEIWHHTELLEKLIQEKRLVPKYAINERITYHDSCYLGRYNGVYDAPRNILRSIPGVELLEMERSRENGMCCGAGGGRMWMEEDKGKRVNLSRVEQALEVNPTIISSGCPYCLTMLNDGTKMKEVEDSIKTRDIAEILLDSMLVS